MWFLILLVILIAILTFDTPNEFVHKKDKRKQIWTR